MRFGDILLFHAGKDGGPESKVDGYWLFRHKRWFTVALLRFNKGSREAYHSHAFNATSWVLTGGLFEHFIDGSWRLLLPSLRPAKTHREDMHRVFGIYESNWVLTFRGPWHDTWQEVLDGEVVTLTHDRKVVSRG